MKNLVMLQTCKNAIPTATPATTRRFFSSHSSPALRQPFSFIILVKSPCWHYINMEKKNKEKNNIAINTSRTNEQKKISRSKKKENECKTTKRMNGVRKKIIEAYCLPVILPGPQLLQPLERDSSRPILLQNGDNLGHKWPGCNLLAAFAWC